MKITLVEFYWVDSGRQDGWDCTRELLNSDKGLDLCFTSAILVKATKHYLYLTSSLSNIEHLSLLEVPKKAIIGKVKKRVKTIKLEI